MRQAWLTALAVLCVSPELRAESGPRVQAKSLPCFSGPELSERVRDQLGTTNSRAWTLRLRKTSKGALTLTLSRAGRRIGRRRFAELPERCEEQRQLVATVAVLAIESWRAEQQTQPKARKRTRRSQSKTTTPSTKRTSGQDADQSSDAGSGTTSDTGADNTASSNRVASQENASAPQQEAPAGESQATARDRESTKRERNAASKSEQRNSSEFEAESNPETGTDPARALAQQQAERQARAQRKRPRQPFRTEGGVGLGAAWGVVAQAGPELDGWVGARRPRLSLRAGLRLNYGLPRSLGPIRLHSGSANVTLQLCLRPGAPSPASEMEFWICLGGMGGMVVAGGQGSDKDRQGLQPTASPTLSVELPVARRGQNHWSIGLRGGVNLVRTRFELLSTQEANPLLYSYTIPTFHLALQIRWRRLSIAR